MFYACFCQIYMRFFHNNFVSAHTLFQNKISGSFNDYSTDKTWGYLFSQ